MQKVIFQQFLMYIASSGSNNFLQTIGEAIHNVMDFRLRHNLQLFKNRKS